jgi:hypothetical protein
MLGGELVRVWVTVDANSTPVHIRAHLEPDTIEATEEGEEEIETL